jgi:predicted transcriptional regulator
MENPGIKTLQTFLSIIKSQEPTTRQRISEDLNRAYGMVNEYLKFCLKTNLIEISKVEHNRGPWPQKFYILTSTGKKLAKILGEINNDLPRHWGLR